MQLTSARIRQLSQDGALPPIHNAQLPAAATCEALAKMLGKRKAKGADRAQPAKERLVEAQADMAVLKLRQAQREVLERHAVELAVSGLAIELRRVVQGLDCTPDVRVRITQQLATLTPETVLARVAEDDDIAEADA
jgi:phage terminase Nu1 subunit (DNA packaging protein)